MYHKPYYMSLYANCVIMKSHSNLDGTKAGGYMCYFYSCVRVYVDEALS